MVPAGARGGMGLDARPGASRPVVVRGSFVRRLLAATGGVITSAGLVLAGTFAALLISGVPFFVQIGFAVTLGIALEIGRAHV